MKLHSQWAFDIVFQRKQIIWCVISELPDISEFLQQIYHRFKRLKKKSISEVKNIDKK